MTPALPAPYRPAARPDAQPFDALAQPVQRGGVAEPQEALPTGAEVDAWAHGYAALLEDAVRELQ